MKGRVCASFSQEEKSTYSDEKSFGDKETTYESEEDILMFDLFSDLEEQLVVHEKKTETTDGSLICQDNESFDSNEIEYGLARCSFSNSREGNFPSQVENKFRPYSGPFSLNLNLNFIDSSLNVQGNYSEYVSEVLKSIVSLRYIDFSKILEEKKNFLDQSSKHKKTLILDLDETLIHSDLENRLDTHDHILTFLYNNELVHIPLNVRPGLFEFLQEVSQHFEIIIFTASKKEYADVILDFLDPDNKTFAKRLYRDSCINVENKIYIKDLRILNRKIEEMIIVDNSLYAFSNQLSNGILINSFYDDRTDVELSNLLSYLQQYILNSPDVRQVNENVFSFKTILEDISKQSE